MSEADAAAGSMSGRGRGGELLLWCGVAGPVLYVASFLVQGLLRPGYDPWEHPISSLSIGPGGWVQITTFVLTGLLVCGYAVGLRRAGCGTWTPVLIGLVGIGLLGAGVSVSDPIGDYPPSTPVPAPRTASGIAHDLFSTPVFTALPAACLVMARRFARSGQRGWAAYSALTAVLFFGAFVLSSIGFRSGGAFDGPGGLWQRVSIVLGFGWMAVLAVGLIRRRAQPLRSSPTVQ